MRIDLTFTASTRLESWSLYMRRLGIVIVLGRVPPVVTLSCTAPAKVNPTPVELPINAAQELSCNSS